MTVYPPQNSKLIVGCGYVGLPLALHWLSTGAQVYATTRSSERAEDFRKLGLNPIQLDVANFETIPSFPEVETVVIAIGFDRRSGKSVEEVYAAGTSNVLARLGESVKRVIYVSSTGVYGDNGDELVTEETPCAPQRDGGKACLLAEQILLTSRFRDRAVILRLAGIYGPGRIPNREAILKGEPIVGGESGYLNLIYLDDAVQAIVKSENAEHLPQVFNVSDGQPVWRGDFYSHIAKVLGVERASIVPPQPGSEKEARSRTSKKIDNSKIVSQLGFRPFVENYQSGIERACVK